MLWERNTVYLNQDEHHPEVLEKFERVHIEVNLLSPRWKGQRQLYALAHLEELKSITTRGRNVLAHRIPTWTI
jgi:hypothetical protein